MPVIAIDTVKVYDMILAYFLEHQSPPSFSQIMREAEVTLRVTENSVKALVKSGKLVQTPAKQYRPTGYALVAEGGGTAPEGGRELWVKLLAELRERHMMAILKVQEDGACEKTRLRKIIADLELEKEEFEREKLLADSQRARQALREQITMVAAALKETTQLLDDHGDKIPAFFGTEDGIAYTHRKTVQQRLEENNHLLDALTEPEGEEWPFGLSDDPLPPSFALAEIVRAAPTKAVAQHNMRIEFSLTREAAAATFHATTVAMRDGVTDWDE